MTIVRSRRLKAMCNCDSPELGYIDGDYQYLYCAVCKLVLGDLADIMIRKELETA